MQMRRCLQKDLVVLVPRLEHDVLCMSLYMYGSTEYVTTISHTTMTRQFSAQLQAFVRFAILSAIGARVFVAIGWRSSVRSGSRALPIEKCKRLISAIGLFYDRLVAIESTIGCDRDFKIQQSLCDRGLRSQNCDRDRDQAARSGAIG